VVDPDLALEPDAPVLFPDRESNVVMQERAGDRAETLRDAEVVVHGRFVNQRLAPVPLETNGALAVPDEDGLTLWVSHQAVFYVRPAVAAALGLDEEKVRVATPAVGGAFGAKIYPYPEHVVVSVLARRLSRPVRYAETRSESLLSMTHGRGQVQEVDLGATRDGTITGLHVRVVADTGAYPGIGWDNHPLTIRMSTGPYHVPRWSSELAIVVTNTTPISAYRGAGRPEATALLERAVDLLARELGQDPVEIRRRNLIPQDAFPYTTPTGLTYDVATHHRALEHALERCDYAGVRAEQARRRQAGDLLRLGIGVSSYAEITGALGGSGSEFGALEVHPDGTATVRTGISPHGQGHETSLAQVAAGVLGIPFESIRVLHSDTASVPQGDGTWGSRSLQLGGSAVYRAAEEVADKARRLAAYLLEASPNDVVLEAGRVGVAGAPDRSFGWGELATAAADPSALLEGMEPGLAADLSFEQAQGSFPFGTHVAMVEVDVESGDARLVRYVAVDDSGRLLNPALAEGQIHGGVAQGVGQALFEEVLYDEDGNPQSADLVSYSVPYASELPSFDTVRLQTPTDLNPLGVKGIGESGAIAAPPAVVNAVVDALADLGIRHIDMPLTPERVWRAVREASPSPSSTPG
jgi:carbon-monoxide dehydrogenase large subunit